MRKSRVIQKGTLFSLFTITIAITITNNTTTNNISYVGEPLISSSQHDEVQGIGQSHDSRITVD